MPKTRTARWTKTNPTSRDAAGRATERAGTQRKRILALLGDAGFHGRTSGELYELLNAHLNLALADHRLKRITQATVAARVAGLCNDGLVSYGDQEPRPNPTGELATVWVLAKHAPSDANQRLKSKRGQIRLANALRVLPLASRIAAIADCIALLKAKYPHCIK